MLAWFFTKIKRSRWELQHSLKSLWSSRELYFLKLGLQLYLGDWKFSFTQGSGDLGSQRSEGQKCAFLHLIEEPNFTLLALSSLLVFFFKLFHPS